MGYDQFISLSAADKLIHGFTHRDGGVSPTPFGSQHMGLLSGVEMSAAWDNIVSLAESFETAPRAIVMTEQVHKTHIEAIHLDRVQFEKRGAYDIKVLKATDGVFTSERGVLLLTFYADCTPIYFYDEKMGVIGMVHSGWRGTAQRIAAAAITHMTEVFGSALCDIKVVIGPSASKCCYEVDDYVKDHFPQQAEFFSQTKPGHYKMDLKGINQSILIASGLSESQIEVSEHCTLCEAERYFSYRREQGHTGRMAAFMMLKP